jgi:hypothetical protein
LIPKRTCLALTAAPCGLGRFGRDRLTIKRTWRAWSLLDHKTHLLDPKTHLRAGSLAGMVARIAPTKFQKVPHNKSSFSNLSLIVQLHKF